MFLLLDFIVSVFSVMDFFHTLVVSFENYSTSYFEGFMTWGIWVAVCILTILNFMGALSFYYLGYLGNLKKIKKEKGLDSYRLQKLTIVVNRYGSWIAIVSIVPYFGDAITVALGYARSPKVLTFILLFLGKLLRSLILAGLVFLLI